MHLVLYFYHNLYLCERNSILETMKTEIIHEMKSSMVHKVQYILIDYMLLRRFIHNSNISNAPMNIENDKK